MKMKKTTRWHLTMLPRRFLTSTPGMGVIYRMKVPNGGWRAPTVSQEQGCLSRGGI